MTLFSSEVPKIEGLTYTPNYITTAQEQFLISKIDEQSWLNDLRRRVQHYGYKYDYKARRITPDLKIGERRSGREHQKLQTCEQIPEWLQILTK